jgi:AcrR family transcriptional regulator
MSTASGSGMVPGARRRSAGETNAAIERAAVELVLEHGYDQVTVDMICEAAGVSQRTFFNHFKTKDAALLGPELPTIDERAAREFIVSDGPLLAEAVGLVRVSPEQIPIDHRLIAERIRAVSTHPALLARQMERLSAIEGELREIIALRLRRQAADGADVAGAAETPEVLESQAELITHMLAGVMRYVGMSWARRSAAGELSPGAALDEGLAELLGGVLRKLG